MILTTYPLGSSGEQMLVQGYPPTLWGEAIIWVVMPIILAAMFLVINGFIAAYIRLNTSRRYGLSIPDRTSLSS